MIDPNRILQMLLLIAAFVPVIVVLRLFFGRHVLDALEHLSRWTPRSRPDCET